MFCWLYSAKSLWLELKLPRFSLIPPVMLMVLLHLEMAKVGKSMLVLNSGMSRTVLHSGSSAGVWHSGMIVLCSGEWLALLNRRMYFPLWPWSLDL